MRCAPGGTTTRISVSSPRSTGAGVPSTVACQSEYQFSDTSTKLVSGGAGDSASVMRPGAQCSTVALDGLGGGTLWSCAGVNACDESINASWLTGNCGLSNAGVT